MQLVVAGRVNCCSPTIDSSTSRCTSCLSFICNPHQLHQPARKVVMSTSAPTHFASTICVKLIVKAIAILYLLTPGCNSQLFSPIINEYTHASHMINSLFLGGRSTECTTSADNRAGVCMPKKACLATGGINAGSCGVLGTCCIYQGSCRSVISANESYFVSPSYPNAQLDRLDPPICIFTLNLLSSPKFPICQVRLDFEEFALAPPYNGTCGTFTDSFVVSGASTFNSSGLPDTGVCGDLSGQHMYFNVDGTNQPLLLVVNAANDRMFKRKWSVRIRQIPCRSPSRAPPGCLQYLTASNGMVESLNFQGFSSINTAVNPAIVSGNGIVAGGGLGPGGIAGAGLQPDGTGSSWLAPNNMYQPLPSPKYMNGLNYAVCISQQPNECGIRWEASDFDFGGGKESLSGVGISSSMSGNPGCLIQLPGSNDQGDYLMIPGASRDGRSELQFAFW